MDTKPHAELPDAELVLTPEDISYGENLYNMHLLSREALERAYRKLAAYDRCANRQLLTALQSIAALTARAEKAEWERDEAQIAYGARLTEVAQLMGRIDDYETELAAVHKRLDAISEEDRMTRNANSNPS